MTGGVIDEPAPPGLAPSRVDRSGPESVRESLTYSGVPGILDVVEVAVSARKHGIPDADILHAWRNVLRVAEQDHGGESRLIAIGPARDGALLELVLVPDDTGHPRRPRPPFLPRPTQVMTMAHTRTKPTATATATEQVEQVEATEKWLDSLDPAQLDFRDASHLRAIIAAAGALATAEGNLRTAVADARAAGDSWTVIGAALGTSKQAAHERFRAFVDH